MVLLFDGKKIKLIKDFKKYILVMIMMMPLTILRMCKGLGRETELKRIL